MKFGPPLLMSSLLFAAACEEPPDSRNRSQVATRNLEKKPAESSATRTFKQRQKEDYEKQLNALRESYTRSIEELKVNVQTLAPEVPADLTKSFAELEERTQAVNILLKKLDTAGVERWEELKPDIHAALDQLEWSYDKTVSQVAALEERRQAMNRGAAPAQEVVSVNATQR